MTARPDDVRPQHPHSQPPVTAESAAAPRTGDQRGFGRCPATAATVGLATAARMLGLSPAAALALAEGEQFPCNVIKTTAGYRVPFASLMRVLRSSRGARRQATQDGHNSPDGER
jgi:hypothetical protein